MTEPPRFVLHDHRQPRPHVDLRLEEDGVLRSWAVPKGLPNDSAHDRDERRIVFTLDGRSDKRRYALIHTGGTQWLLHLTKAQPDSMYI